MDNFKQALDNRDFKGLWLTKSILSDNKLTPTEKMFLAEIHCLDNDQGCFAANRHFAELFGMQESNCSRVINSLLDKGYLDISEEKGSGIFKRRVIRISTEKKGVYLSDKAVAAPLIKLITPPYQNDIRGYQIDNRPYQNDKVENTIINTSNKTRERGALAFLQSNSPSQLQTFMMQNKKQIDDWDKFVLDFEAAVILGEIPFETNKLFARLGQYARNWIKNNSSGRFQGGSSDQPLKRLYDAAI